MDTRPETVIITRREAGILVDWLPVWLREDLDMPESQRATMKTMHIHLARFFGGDDD